MPSSVRKWLSEHPQYMNPNDHIAQAELNLATMKCVRDGLTWNDDNFLPNIERHLGIAQSNGKNLPRNEPQPPPYNGATPRPLPQRQSVQPPAAAPSREVPSMRTGRPLSDSMKPTELDREYARIAGVSLEQYLEGKRRMQFEKAQGLHGGG
jgi:hypothetical protein